MVHEGCLDNQNIPLSCGIGNRYTTYLNCLLMTYLNHDIILIIIY